jgi:hypothetical protein
MEKNKELEIYSSDHLGSPGTNREGCTRGLVPRRGAPCAGASGIRLDGPARAGACGAPRRERAGMDMSSIDGVDEFPEAVVGIDARRPAPPRSVAARVRGRAGVDG